MGGKIVHVHVPMSRFKVTLTFQELSWIYRKARGQPMGCLGTLVTRGTGQGGQTPKGHLCNGYVNAYITSDWLPCLWTDWKPDHL